MCIHPINAWFSTGFNKNGRQVLHFTPPSDIEMAVANWVKVPCGKCIGCLDDRRKRWVNRLLLEFDISRVGTFVTLTYKDAPLHPLKCDVQKFIKRLRNSSRDYGVKFPKVFKYFFCAERGSQFGRPHYHGLLFGLDMLLPEWKPYVATFKSGYPVWSSRVLEQIWPFGFVTVDSITPRAIRYVSKYTVKTTGQEDTFTLKSMRLGVSKFFDIYKSGSNVSYDYNHQDSRRLLMDGNIHLDFGDSSLINVRIPSSFKRYVERVSDTDLEDYKINRQLDAFLFSRKKFDNDAYVERLIDDQKKDKLKRKLDYGKDHILNS